MRERGHLEDLDVDVALILKLITNKWVRQATTGWIWLRIGTGGMSLQGSDGTWLYFLNG